MTEQEAQTLVKETMEAPFCEERFGVLTGNMLNYAAFSHEDLPIKNAYSDYVSAFERIATYTDADDKQMDVLIVYLRVRSVRRARKTQRNIVAGHLRRNDKDAALVALTTPGARNWRFSFMQLYYHYEGGQVREKLTPARGDSFLVGEGENCHTAQRRLLPLLCEDGRPRLEDVGEVFDAEDAFSEEYKELSEEHRGLSFHLRSSERVWTVSWRKIHGHTIIIESEI